MCRWSITLVRTQELSESHSGCLLFLYGSRLLIVIFPLDCNCWSWLSVVDCRRTVVGTSEESGQVGRATTTTARVWGKLLQNFAPRPMSGETPIAWVCKFFWQTCVSNPEGQDPWRKLRKECDNFIVLTRKKVKIPEYTMRLAIRKVCMQIYIGIEHISQANLFDSKIKQRTVALAKKISTLNELRSDETALHKPLPSSCRQSDRRSGRRAVCQVSSHLAPAGRRRRMKNGALSATHAPHPVNIRDILQVSSILVNSDWCIVHTLSKDCSRQFLGVAIRTTCEDIINTCCLALLFEDKNWGQQTEVMYPNCVYHS